MKGSVVATSEATEAIERSVPEYFLAESKNLSVGITDAMGFACKAMFGWDFTMAERAYEIWQDPTIKTTLEVSGGITGAAAALVTPVAAPLALTGVGFPEAVAMYVVAPGFGYTVGKEIVDVGYDYIGTLLAP